MPKVGTKTLLLVCFVTVAGLLMAGAAVEEGAVRRPAAARRRFRKRGGSGPREGSP